MLNYLRGIFYAILGRVEVRPPDYSCKPHQADPKDADEFFDDVQSKYADVLKVLAA